MSFEEFKGIWKVGTATSGETAGHRVAIGGKPTAVTIICIDAEAAHSFDGGTYRPNPEQIEVLQDNILYRIRLERGATNKITCEPAVQGPPGPGSWTADDNVGGAGGRGGRR